jgi:uncharacterized OB-fold protein
MFNKCGQQNNTHYTFGVTDKQMKEDKEAQTVIKHTCPHCGQTSTIKTNFCPTCGEES